MRPTRLTALDTERCVPVAQLSSRHQGQALGFPVERQAANFHAYEIQATNSPGSISST
jgi:hypothetical protein